MKPYVISLLNQKGGVGKTTIAINLAYGLILRSYKVLLVDADPQGSTRDWNEGNEANLVPVVGLDRETLPKDLEAISDGYDFVVIDTPPRVARVMAAAIRASDLIIIPVQPSPHDVLATAETVEIVKERQSIVGDGSPHAVFVLSRVIKNSVLSRDVLEPLNEYGFSILGSTISQHVWYALSQADGQTVYSDRNTLACKEFGRFIDEVFVKYINV